MFSSSLALVARSLSKQDYDENKDIFFTSIFSLTTLSRIHGQSGNFFHFTESYFIFSKSVEFLTTSFTFILMDDSLSARTYKMLNHLLSTVCSQNTAW